MARTKRPKTLLVLLLFFVWVDARAIGWLLFPETSGSYHSYESLGRGWIHFVIHAGTLALAATATAYLWRPRSGWLEASVIALGAFALATIAGTWYTVSHVDLARAAYAAGRAARGLPPASEQRLAELFTPAFLWAGGCGMAAFYMLLALFAWRRRDYVAAEARSVA